VSDAETSVYDVVGPSFFVELVERFYEGVAGDAVLRPLYPGEDLSDAPGYVGSWCSTGADRPTTATRAVIRDCACGTRRS
jgi:hypothetical protein